ncbi:MAG: S4 domain-containing protein [Opitutales bacterium]|nr:S4 domain-containing protein [Opitutales bacterium]
MSKSKDPPPRINRFLADCGLGSRRSCETIVTEGRVLINDQPCLSLAARVREDDKVTVDGRTLQRQNDEVNILLYKPVGYLCSRNDPEGRPTI